MVEISNAAYSGRAGPTWAFDPVNAVDVAGYGFWLSIAGMVLTLAGFGLTLQQLAMTRRAADAAKAEAVRIRKSLNQYETANEAAKATAALATARNYVRSDLWVSVVDSYEVVRDALTALKVDIAELDDVHKTAIDAAASYIHNLCSRIERDRIRGTSTVDAAKTLAVMADHRTLLQSLTRIIEKGVIE